MMWQWWALGGLALMALALLVALTRLRTRTTGEIGAAREEAAELRQRLDALERSTLPPPAQVDVNEYRITGIGDPEPDEPVDLERAVFADLLLRESVIRLGSLGHGVRRALSAQSRNRIRFEMKRELKRTRKQRRVEQREAYRDWQARQRDSQEDVA